MVVCVSFVCLLASWHIVSLFYLHLYNNKSTEYWLEANKYRLLNILSTNGVYIQVCFSVFIHYQGFFPVFFQNCGHSGPKSFDVWLKQATCKLKSTSSECFLLGVLKALLCNLHVEQSLYGFHSIFFEKFKVKKAIHAYWPNRLHCGLYIMYPDCNVQALE